MYSNNQHPYNSVKIHKACGWQLHSQIITRLLSTASTRPLSPCWVLLTFSGQTITWHNLAAVWNAIHIKRSCTIHIEIERPKETKQLRCLSASQHRLSVHRKTSSRDSYPWVFLVKTPNYCCCCCCCCCVHSRSVFPGQRGFQFPFSHPLPPILEQNHWRLVE